VLCYLILIFPYNLLVLIFKLSIVPIFILLITLVGRKWGSTSAGLLGALPAVAGPIIIFIALEEGNAFAALTATSAVAAASCLLIFGVSYSWCSMKFSWPITLLYSLTAWLGSAFILALTSPNLITATIIAISSLLITPKILPHTKPSKPPQGNLRDLPWRMLVGAILTLTVTSLAVKLGETWCGILAVFPVIGVVLSVFTHKALGFAHVTLIYQGMVKGLFSSVAFFTSLALILPNTTIWMACGLSASIAILTQIIALHYFLKVEN